MIHELKNLTIAAASTLISHREISPVELLEGYLARIGKLNHSLNCFITLTPDLALDEARQAENEIVRGNYRGPLHGIPVALKDLYETQGLLTTAGSKFFADYVPELNAFTVDRLYQAGAISLGKLNMHEIALGVTNENPHYGPCRNPWDPRRIPGGSSGGSAAAVAAGMCLGSLGSDTGGSIRIPAALCGVVGLKPTRGRVSLRGVIPLSWNLDHAGPMARCVRDAAILLQAVAGYDPLDPYSVNCPVDDYLSGLEAGIRGWRVALAVGEYFSVTESKVWQAVQQAARVFESLGATVEEVEIPGLCDMAQANGLMVTSDAAAFHCQRLETNPEGFGEDVRRRLLKGAAATSTEYALARHLQALACYQLGKFFETYALLLTPVTPSIAPLLGSADAVERVGQLTRYTAPFNLTGLPALSLPCGFVDEGEYRLPVGLQVAAPPWAEASLLCAAWAYEQVAGWSACRPPG